MPSLDNRSASSLSGPFLRVVRDKRGYETTYLMDMYRDGNRQRSRILYAFRSPANVRVGRIPLERETIQEIEGRHRDIVFDWKAVLASCQVIDSTLESRVPRRRRKVVSGEAPEGGSGAQESAASSTADASDVARVTVPALIEGTTADDQAAFLARWYPVILEQIPRYTVDPVRREALSSLAERLNPAAWVDADQVASGLQQAAVALERLSLVLNKRRRRRSRRVRRSSEPSGQDEAQTPDTSEPPSSGASGPEA